MITAKINDLDIVVEDNTTILEAARKLQVKIPVLCKHPDLPPAAACGICVVKLKGSNKMLRACSTLLENGMEVITHDPEIVETRKIVLELILSQHPNECLTCARNKNCELQTMAAEFGIREEYYEKMLQKVPRDDSTKAVVLEPSKCIKCGRCVLVCQQLQNVWALSFVDRGHETRMAPAADVSLEDSPCVKCGQCSAHCPTGAIYEYDETQKVWDALQDPEKYCVVQIAPAVRVAIGERFGFSKGANVTGKLYTLLRRLGFEAVFDTSFGADITIMEEATEFVKKYTESPETLPLITSCCPAWVDFLEKFHPDMIEYFSTCKSPHQIIGVLSKTYYANIMGIDPDKIVMVSIMPCTAKKHEITRDYQMFSSGRQDIDISLTTRELSRMINQAGIDFFSLPESDPDHILADYSGGGVIFGATGGVMEAALRSAYYFATGENLKRIEFDNIRGLDGVKEAEIPINGNKIKVAVAHGLSHVETVLNEVRKAKENNQPTPYHFIEVMACPGGCIGGGGQPVMIDDEVRLDRSRGLYEDDKTKNIRNCHNNPYIKKLYDEFLGKPNSAKSHELLHTTYKARKDYRFHE
jgi:NADH-quinone oxidoreductase subunit G